MHYNSLHTQWEYLIRICRGGAWTSGQALGGVRWQWSRGVQTDEGCGQEVSLGRHAGGCLDLIVLESPFSFT